MGVLCSVSEGAIRFCLLFFWVRHDDLMDVAGCDPRRAGCTVWDAARFGLAFSCVAVPQCWVSSCLRAALLAANDLPQ